MESDEVQELYSSLVSEFIIIGIDSVASAKRLITELTYRGDILFSIPNRWAFGGEFLSRLFAFGLEVPSIRREPYYFSSMINNMSSAVSYIHCFVVYEEITNLIIKAKESLIPEGSFVMNTMDLSPLKETQADKDHDPEQFFITEPTEINKNQDKFFFPFVFAFKTEGVYHSAFRGLLEGLFDILRCAPKEKGFRNQEDLHWYRLMRFAANLFFLINDFARPTTSAILKFQCFPNEQSIDFHEKSVLNLPFSEEILLLSVFEIELEALIFLWKSLVLGINVLVLSESDAKRFNIMEALTFLIFPFSSPPIKIPNFSMRIDSDAGKMIIMAGKVFLGLSSKHADLEVLIEEPFLKENYHIVDLDTSEFHPNKYGQKPAMNLQPFEIEMLVKLRSLRGEYLAKIAEIALGKKQDIRQQIISLQRSTAIAIYELFFKFFEQEEQFSRIEKRFLNLKKVKYLRQHKFILKETNKLIEGFSKPRDFVQEMVYEHTFLNFASELPGFGLSSSFRFKSIMARIDLQKLKLPIINPALSIKIGIDDSVLIWFYQKMKVIGEKEGWGPIFLETISEGLERLESVLKSKKLSENVQFGERTSLMLGPLHLVGFLRKVTGRWLRFEEKYDENQEEAMLRSLKAEIGLMSFGSIVLEDFDLLLSGKPGRILNIADDPTLEVTRHLLLSNQAVFQWFFQQKSESSPLMNNKTDVLAALFNSFREFKAFEQKYLSEAVSLKKMLDFPDFPRNLFQKMVFGDQKKLNPANNEEVEEFLAIMTEIDRNSSLITLLNQRLNTIKASPNITDLVSNFPIICYNYLNFLKKGFRSYDFLSVLNTPCRFKIREAAKKKQISKILNKIKQEYKSDIKHIEEVFTQLESPNNVHKRPFTDYEKLLFAINFFNLRLLHSLLFHFLTDENNSFPGSPYNWLDFCEKLKFKLFGLEFSLLDLDISVIRQNLCSQQIFIPKLDFITQLLSNEDHQLFKKKEISREFSFFHRNKIKEEKLINFTFFYAIRDTPIFRIFDEPMEMNATLVEHAKEFFAFFKKFNNFQFFQKEKELGVPIPKEVFVTYEEDFGFTKEKKLKLLGHYYDERLKNISVSKVRLEYVPVKWDQFYLSPNYFG